MNDCRLRPGLVPFLVTIGVILASRVTLAADPAEKPLAAGEAREDNLIISSPIVYQVFQRSADERAQVAISGVAAGGATVIEAKAEITAGKRGRAVPWTVVAQGDQIRQGRFSGRLRMATGGWHSLHIRSRKGPRDQDTVGRRCIDKIGVGDVFITAGQSNSTNFGQPTQKADESLVVYFDGKTFTPAADPIPDSIGGGGTPWPILGDMLARSTRAPVCFRSATVNYLRVRDWVPGAKTKNMERLVERAKWFGPGGVRAVLWVQGEADSGRPDYTPKARYVEEMTAMIEGSRKQMGYPVDWFVSGTSYCPPNPGNDWKEGIATTLAAQKTIWDKGIAFRGPDTNDLIGPKYRPDGIHFGTLGLRVHAERWYVAISSRYHFANPVTCTMK